MRSWLAALLGALATACVAPPEPAAAAAPATVPSAAVRHPVRLLFEPPLAAPGRLEFAHECGERGVVATTRLGVELALPAGPAALVLHADGRRHERPYVVGAGQPPEVWQLAPRLRVGGDGIVDAAVERRRARR